MPVLVIGETKYPYKFLGQWSNKDGMAVQQATGLKWGEFVDGVNDGDLEALTAFVWMILRKNGQPDLRFGDVEFAFDEVSHELTDEEQAQSDRVTAEKEAAAAEADPTQAGSPPSARKTRASRGSGAKVSSA